MDLYSLTAATTARKVAEARAARKAYEKWTTRAAQVVVLLEDAVQAATNAAAAAPHGKKSKSWAKFGPINGCSARPWGRRAMIQTNERCLLVDCSGHLISTLHNSAVYARK